MQPDENFWKKCEGEQIANAYELELLLGCGAFGGVFRAVQIANGRRLNKRVAVKLMFSGTIQQEELNFALDLPSHQNLVQHFTGNNVEIRDFSMFYLVMELADCSLADFVRKQGGQISSAESKPIVRDIAQGLKYLHELDAGNSQDKRYVHRDLKLLNVLQVGGVWKIADFGLSKALDRGTMQASKIVGTPYYMPPELFRNSYVSTKWDVWSLGVMIVEMLTGHFPFESPYYDELTRKIQIDIPDLEGVPSEWIDIVKSCLIRDHNERWAAVDVLTALNSPSLKATVFSKTATDFFDDGRKKHDEKDFKGAITDYNEAIRLNPDFADAYYSRGLAKSALGDKQGAITDYNEAIRLNPNYDKAYNNRGNAKKNLGDKQGAIADYNEAIRLNPNYANAYINRGLAKYELGDKQGAIADYNETIRLNPNNATAYTNRGSAKYELGDKQGAIADYNEAIRLNPNLAEAYNNRGVAKDNFGDNQGAIADYNEAIRLNPNYAEAYNNRGAAKSALGDKQGAITDYNESIRLKPDYAPAYMGRGNAKFALEDKQGAIADYDESIRLKNSELHLPYNNRGIAKSALGDKQGAITDYNEAIRLKPDYAPAYMGRGLIKKERGEKQEALADFRKASELYQLQGNIEWYNNSRDRIRELGG
jgi:tetratricopeptide (TPR) repeat protein